MSQADRVRITILVENWIDMLLPDGDCLTRCGLIHHFDPRRTPLQAENGISFVVETMTGDRRATVLFDCGLTPAVIQHNVKALGVDATRIDHIVISHGHPDHYGGLAGIVPLIGHPVAVGTHPDAFEPRYVVMPTGEVSPFYNSSLNRAELEALGARFVLSRQALDLAPGISTTGEIELDNDFEGPHPPVGYRGGLFQVRDGRVELDQVLDEVALIINVRNCGLIVLAGCGHRGMVNSIRKAQRLTGVNRVVAAIGGFHLGFPGVPEQNVSKTLESLRDLGVELIMPTHCSGLKMLAAAVQRLPDSFVQYSVGTQLEFS